MGFAEDLAALTVEFLDALSSVSPAAARHWRGNAKAALERMLERDHADVEWVFDGVDPVPNEEDIDTVYSEEGFEPSEEDRQFAIAAFEELAEKRDDYAVPADDVPWDVSCDWDEPDVGPHEYDMQDPGDDDPLPARPASEDVLVAEPQQPSADPLPVPDEAGGLLCNIRELQAPWLALVQERFSWVKTMTDDSPCQASVIRLVSIFPENPPVEYEIDRITPIFSMDGYGTLLLPYRQKNLACGFAQAVEIERTQDSIPLLRSLPNGTVIDFPGIRARGVNGEYGILRIRRKGLRWKLEFEWIADRFRARMWPDMFGAHVRIAVIS